MTELKKTRIKTVLKYTWPFYFIVALIIFIAMGVIFRVAHPIPAYKVLTVFVAGRVVDSNKLSKDMLVKFEDKEIRSFSCMSARPTDSHYSTKLTVNGYQSADVLILPTSTLEGISDLGSIAIKLSDALVNSYYQGYSFYAQNEINYGIKIDKDKVSEYMTLPDEDCFMLLNGRSKNLGDYTLSEPVSEHDMALLVAKDWGM